MAAMLMLALGMQSVQAQDMHFSQFNGAPMILNPALAGGISGMYRVTGIYRNQWNSVTTPYVTFGGSFDAPIKRDIAIDDHLGGGISIYNDRSGDGNLANLTALATAAYHKFFGENSNMSLSVGLQGGFTQKTIDLQRLYWGDEFRNGGFQGGTTGELLKPKVQHFTAAAGLNWQHAIGESGNFAYSIGLSGHNLNQPRESFLQKTNNEVGLGMFSKNLKAQLSQLQGSTSPYGLRVATTQTPKSLEESLNKSIKSVISETINKNNNKNLDSIIKKNLRKYIR
jgi:type IX secretion system PorP/SprF family membrane protein